MLLTALRSDTLERMGRAVEEVTERLLNSTSALETAGVPYAVIGGNAVAAWVAQVDRGAVRNTRDVDLLIRRSDLPQAIRAMAVEGWIHAEVAGVDLFVKGERGMPSEGIHLIFAGEKVRSTDAVAAPNIEECVTGEQFQLISLDALVRMKLVAYHRKDQVHLQDMIQLKMIDSSWPEKYPPPLDERLRILLADPEG